MTQSPNKNLLIDGPVRNRLKYFTNCVLVTLKLLRRKYACISRNDSSLGSPIARQTILKKLRNFSATNEHKINVNTARSRALRPPIGVGTLRRARNISEIINSSRKRNLIIHGQLGLNYATSQIIYRSPVQWLYNPQLSMNKFPGEQTHGLEFRQKEH